MKPLFTNAMIANRLKDYVGVIENRSVEALMYIGEDFVNKARDIKTYEDRTGNLRSSIGYIVINDGAVVQLNTKESDKGDKDSVGITNSKKISDELISENPQGLILIVFAGMDYAASVESKNFDVISGSEPSKSELKDILEGLLR